MGIRQIIAPGKPEHSICSPELQRKIDHWLQKERRRNLKLHRGRHPRECSNLWCNTWYNNAGNLYYIEYDKLPWRPALRLDPPVLLGPFKTSDACAEAKKILLRALSEIDLGKIIQGAGGGILLYRIYLKGNKYRVYTTEFGVGVGPLVGEFSSLKEADRWWPKHQDSILHGKELLIGPPPW